MRRSERLKRRSRIRPAWRLVASLNYRKACHRCRTDWQRLRGLGVIDAPEPRRDGRCSRCSVAIWRGRYCAECFERQERARREAHTLRRGILRCCSGVGA